MQLSLFYFADAATGKKSTGSTYQLLLDGARYADAHGFAAVWIPERHFHPVGGLYPNPAVLGAAVATVTERVHIRAGSVVVPLHHPLRLVEEWSVVDNLSNGRVGISLASGWNPRDFVLAPGAYEHRRDSTFETVQTLRDLWSGQSFGDGASKVSTFPPPVAPLQLWISSSGTLDTFEEAGRAQAGVLTHLVKQDIPELAKKIRAYRTALAKTGSSWRGHVTLMLHTYLAPSREQALQDAQTALEDYLIGSLTPYRTGASQRVAPDTHETVRAQIKDSAQRYLNEAGLIGDLNHARQVINLCHAAGVDEVACLIDFGLKHERVIEGLDQLSTLQKYMSELEQPVVRTAHA
ncbi:natural product biosynthesis luciferase-like monooxygenase domain [Pseudomonas asplenii]|uniref:Natural product biosynthesis luciferase-like monooxygenase domain n=1 Tax=Pseudomonas asplenii TaxID=53407 RepID=A0A0M9GHY8_9PSED|nr:MupA/Atu3671 family FMN-dependent luciferase-like monooxygenase [Pseudomonas fuscovaginae]KPA91708.1 natural product biosynthesis luciferase-like monooxygenase domain [Pseudomonas fuscovaginae]